MSRRAIPSKPLPDSDDLSAKRTKKIDERNESVYATSGINEMPTYFPQGQEV